MRANACMHTEAEGRGWEVGSVGVWDWRRLLGSRGLKEDVVDGGF